MLFLSTIDIDGFSLCNHEGTDARMLLHLKDFSATGHCKVSLKTVDTDVVVIAISLFHKKLDLEELWVEFGTGVNLEWLPIHKYAENLGESMCQVMSVWFAFKGCDTISTFFGHGKRLAWNILKCCNRCIQNVSYDFIIITIWLTS